MSHSARTFSVTDGGPAGGGLAGRISLLQGIFRTKSLNAILASAEAPESQLRRSLGAVQLTLLGIGAIIGAGIFSTVGTAAAGTVDRPGAGPALVISFILTAFACGFAALCYAEFASMVPVSGSAYTYSYATLGELVGWIIGWDLIIEYAVGNVAVAISWSGYFQELLRAAGIEWPLWLGTDYRTAVQSAGQVAAAQAGGTGLESLGLVVTRSAQALEEAPLLFGFPIVFNLPAFLIVMLITVVLVIGIRESVWFNSAMVALKLAIIGFFIVMGLFYVNPENWTPFAPNGVPSIITAAAIIFFAYIGFDAVSTAAEETKNPKRDMPIAIIASLVVCTVIYIAVAAGAHRHAALDPARHGGAAGDRLFGPGDELADDHHLPRRRLRHHLGAAGVPAWPAAHLLLDGPRRSAPAVGGPGPPASTGRPTSRPG